MLWRNPNSNWEWDQGAHGCHLRRFSATPVLSQWGKEGGTWVLECTVPAIASPGVFVNCTPSLAGLKKQLCSCSSCLWGLDKWMHFSQESKITLQSRKAESSSAIRPPLLTNSSQEDKLRSQENHLTFFLGSVPNDLRIPHYDPTPSHAATLGTRPSTLNTLGAKPQRGYVHPVQCHRFLCLLFQPEILS